MPASSPGELAMIGLMLLASALLATPDDPPPSPADAATLAEYNGRRAKVANTAEAHWKLGLWCEEHGLKAEAEAEFTAVTRLDPKREAAWKRLGFKKHNGRWMSDAQITAGAEQTKANRRWGPALAKLHDRLHDRKIQQAARAELAAIQEPEAVPSIWHVFGTGGAGDQVVAVQLLGQVPTPSSSKLLAILAVFGKTEEVRRLAAETLRGRDPGEFAATMIALLRVPLNYEVRPVAGPGSRGVLFVEGEKVNLQRVYSAPATQFSEQAGNGFKYVLRGHGATLDPYFDAGQTNPVASIASRMLTEAASQRNQGEALKAAVAAEKQLEADIAAVESLNAAIRESNDRVRSVLVAVAGKDLGQDRQEWSRWLADQQGRTQEAPRSAPKRTIQEFVPLAYVPSFTNVFHYRPG
jgi:hypothetical protein